MNFVWLYYLWAALLILAAAGAWVTTLVTLPGNWFIAGMAALFAWWIPAEAGQGVTWTTVLVLLGLALLGEVVEFGASAAGAAKRGASKRGIVLSMVGALFGSMLGLMVGTPIPVLGSFVMAILGGALGAYCGAYLGEGWKGRQEEDRKAVGRGAFAGRIWGTIGKLAVGVVMLVILAWDSLR
ncbi:MAG: DUF456 domain-containing protein [Pirellulales bacterium]|nr:DUF456 domain-containing protein [Pirellulales bacterium]